MIYFILLLFFLMLGLWYLFFQKSSAHNISPLYNEKPVLTADIIEYKLRNTIYNLEQQIIQIEQEIEDLYEQEMQILQMLGKPTFVSLPSQELYFIAIHPFKKEDKYYYIRDLNKSVNEADLTTKKQTLENYNVHIQVALSKWTLHTELLKVHQQNLNALESLDTQKKQLQKDNLSILSKSIDKDIKNEINTQYAMELLSVIDEELQNRAEYLKQYILLREAYDTSDNIQVHQVYKIKIDEIIQQMKIKS